MCVPDADHGIESHNAAMMQLQEVLVQVAAYACPAAPATHRL